jgi:hypothetical protein
MAWPAKAADFLPEALSKDINDNLWKQEACTLFDPFGGDDDRPSVEIEVFDLFKDGADAT